MGLLLWSEACPGDVRPRGGDRGEPGGTVPANVQSAGQLVKATTASQRLTFWAATNIVAPTSYGSPQPDVSLQPTSRTPASPLRRSLPRTPEASCTNARS